jgi:hypothetical protein
VSEIFDSLLGAVCAFDIDASIGVSQGFRFHTRGQGSYFPGKFKDSRVLIVTKFKLGICEARCGTESGKGRGSRVYDSAKGWREQWAQWLSQRV